MNSFTLSLSGHLSRFVIHDDAGEEHTEVVRARYPYFDVIGGERLGFGGAIDRAWRWVASNTSEPFVFAVEDDFTFNRRVSLDGMVEVMNHHRHIAQMALRRQPWNDTERRAGGVVELHPEAYVEREWNGWEWLEHRLFWTTNASLFHSQRCRDGWPVMGRSEGIYSAQVFADPDAVCGYWGSRSSGEAIHHIGEQRAGVGY